MDDEIDEWSDPPRFKCGKSDCDLRLDAKAQWHKEATPEEIEEFKRLTDRMHELKRLGYGLGAHSNVAWAILAKRRVWYFVGTLAFRIIEAFSCIGIWVLLTWEMAAWLCLPFFLVQIILAAYQAGRDDPSEWNTTTDFILSFCNGLVSIMKNPVLLFFPDNVSLVSLHPAGLDGFLWYAWTLVRNAIICVLVILIWCGRLKFHFYLEGPVRQNLDTYPERETAYLAFAYPVLVMSIAVMPIIVVLLVCNKGIKGSRHRNLIEEIHAYSAGLHDLREDGPRYRIIEPVSEAELNSTGWFNQGLIYASTGYMFVDNFLDIYIIISLILLQDWDAVVAAIILILVFLGSCFSQLRQICCGNNGKVNIREGLFALFIEAYKSARTGFYTDEFYSITESESSVEAIPSVLVTAYFLPRMATTTSSLGIPAWLRIAVYLISITSSMICIAAYIFAGWDLGCEKLGEDDVFDLLSQPSQSLSWFRPEDDTAEEDLLLSEES